MKAVAATREGDDSRRRYRYALALYTRVLRRPSYGITHAVVRGLYSKHQSGQ